MFKTGEKIAWTMFDGNVMAGEVVDKNTDHYITKRVDGSVCHVRKTAARAAGHSEIERACKFFALIGK